MFLLLLSVSLLLEAGLQNVTSHLSLETMAQLYNRILHILPQKIGFNERKFQPFTQMVSVFLTVGLGADQYNQSVLLLNLRFIQHLLSCYLRT